MYQNPYAYAPFSHVAPQYTYQVIPQAPAIAPRGVKGAAVPVVPPAPGLQKNKKNTVSKVHDFQQKVEEQQTVDTDEQQQQQIEEPVEQQQQQQVEEAVKGDRKTVRRDYAKGERKGVKATTELTVIERKEEEVDKKVKTKIEKDEDDVSVTSKESSRTVSEDKETNTDGFTRRKRSFRKHY